MQFVTLFNQGALYEDANHHHFLGTSAGLKWVTLARGKVFNEQCDPALLATRFQKAPRVAGCLGTLLLLRQHLSLWHKAGATCTKMTSFGHKNRFRGPSMSDLQHLSFVVGRVGVPAGADGRWSPSSPSDIPPVSSFTLQALLHALASN